MDAQHAVEGTVRIIGCVAVFALTLGRYRGPQKDGLLLEGGFGLLMIAGGTYLMIQ